MSYKPKDKAEAQAKKREWIDAIKTYLMVILMCLVVIGIWPDNDPVNQLAMIVGLLAAVIGDFVLYTLPDSDKPPMPVGTPRRLGGELHERVNIVILIAIVVYVVSVLFVPSILAVLLSALAQ